MKGTDSKFVIRTDIETDKLASNYLNQFDSLFEKQYNCDEMDNCLNAMEQDCRLKLGNKHKPFSKELRPVNLHRKKAKSDFVFVNKFKVYSHSNMPLPNQYKELYFDLEIQLFAAASFVNLDKFFSKDINMYILVPESLNETTIGFYDESVGKQKGHLIKETNTLLVPIDFVNLPNKCTTASLKLENKKAFVFLVQKQYNFDNPKLIDQIAVELE